MATPKITKREFLLAQAFLKALKGNSQNTYLVLAVVAWTRAMGKAQDRYWKSLKGLSAASAGARLAKRLAAKAAAGKYKGEYKAIIKRMREQHKGGDAMAEQAGDFILAIEKSHYDADHYGLVQAKDGYWKQVWHQTGWGSGYFENVWVPPVEYKNPLWNAYAKLTNKPGIPDSWWMTKTTTTKTTTTPPRPTQPRSLMHVLPEPNYIQPYAAQAFYDSKPHYGDFVLPDG